MVCRLAGRSRQTPSPRLHQQSQSHALPAEEAERDQSKKSPGIGSVRSICEAWSDAYQFKSHEARTARDLAKHAGTLNPSQLNELVVIGLAESWRKQDYAPATIYSRTSALRKLLGRFAAIGAPDLRPFIPKAKAPRPRNVVIQTEHLEAALRKAPAHLKLFIRLCSDLALRYTEARTLCAAQWDPLGKQIRIITKGKKPRTVPVTEEIADLIRSADPGRQDPLIPLIDILAGYQLAEGTLRRQWKRLIVSVGGDPRINPHDLRRTTANRLYALTKDLRSVQEMLGHDSMRSTMHYLEPFDPGHLRELLELLRTPQKGPVQ